MSLFAGVALYFLDAGMWWWVAYGVYVVVDCAMIIDRRRR
jgi:hypothetical protein